MSSRRGSATSTPPELQQRDERPPWPGADSPGGPREAAAEPFGAPRKSSNGALCQCGAPQEMHARVAMEDCFGTAIVNQWDSAQHSSEYPTDAFGALQFAGTSKRQSHFLRLSCDTQPDVVYKLLTTDWAIPRPNLVVSVAGGEGKMKLKSWVRDVLRQGLVRAAQST
ncbi:hypothetical protein Z043_124255, partial [Scleropages formosus]